MPETKTGSCECGAVTYETRGELRPIVACHCTQCRKLTGHHMAATASLEKDLTITKGDNDLTWYQSSDFAKRGFCSKCGSQLFWQQKGSPQVSITAGSFDDDSGIGFWGHIFTSDKGSYYEIPADELQCDDKPDDYPRLD